MVSSRRSINNLAHLRKKHNVKQKRQKSLEKERSKIDNQKEDGLTEDEINSQKRVDFYIYFVERPKVRTVFYHIEYEGQGDKKNRRY